MLSTLKEMISTSNDFFWIIIITSIIGFFISFIYLFIHYLKRKRYSLIKSFFISLIYSIGISIAIIIFVIIFLICISIGFIFMIIGYWVFNDILDNIFDE